MALQNSTPSIAAGVDDAVRRQATQFTLVDDKWLIDIVRAYMASRNPPLQYFPNPFRGDWSELIKLRVEPNGYSWESNVKKIAERFRTLRHNYNHNNIPAFILRHLEDGVNVFQTNPIVEQYNEERKKRKSPTTQDVRDKDEDDAPPSPPAPKRPCPAPIALISLEDETDDFENVSDVFGLLTKTEDAKRDIERKQKVCVRIVNILQHPEVYDIIVHKIPRVDTRNVFQIITTQKEMAKEYEAQRSALDEREKRLLQAVDQHMRTNTSSRQQIAIPHTNTTISTSQREATAVTSAVPSSSNTPMSPTLQRREDVLLHEKCTLLLREKDEEISRLSARLAKVEEESARRLSQYEEATRTVMDLSRESDETKRLLKEAINVKEVLRGQFIVLAREKDALNNQIAELSKNKSAALDQLARDLALAKKNFAAQLALAAELVRDKNELTLALRNAVNAREALDTQLAELNATSGRVLQANEVSQARMSLEMDALRSKQRDTEIERAELEVRVAELTAALEHAKSEVQLLKTRAETDISTKTIGESATSSTAVEAAAPPERISSRTRHRKTTR